MAPIPSKKVAAALAAVLQHASEAEGAVSAAAAAPPASPSPAHAMPVAAPSFWRCAGRQDAMLDRTLWQRRLSKRW